ncbi:MAG TPA: hypothetical protein VNH11_18335 [Pirellulales bacterium]|nr:hypothetical protein [Pirellulales bacterium]
MNVQEFVCESLLQIARAVVQANKEFAAISIAAQANPPGVLFESDAGTRHAAVPDTHAIHFDIAVTVAYSAEKTSSKKAGLALTVVSGGLDTANASDSSSSATSRIRFAVPLKLPRPA